MSTKYRGIIGYEVTEPKEEGSDVYVSNITERYARGTINKNVSRRENGQWLNDDLRLANTVSIVADPFALAHFQNIKYCVLYEQKWLVTMVDVDEPNLILTLGGAYHEQT